MNSPDYDDGFADGYHAGWRACARRALRPLLWGGVLVAITFWVIACIITLGKAS